jgi:hypothetical protein
MGGGAAGIAGIAPIGGEAGIAAVGDGMISAGWAGAAISALVSNSRAMKRLRTMPAT